MLLNLFYNKLHRIFTNFNNIFKQKLIYIYNIIFFTNFKQFFLAIKNLFHKSLCFVFYYLNYYQLLNYWFIKLFAQTFPKFGYLCLQYFPIYWQILEFIYYCYFISRYCFYFRGHSRAVPGHQLFFGILSFCW